jgi:hypothetical protein
MNYEVLRCIYSDRLVSLRYTTLVSPVLSVQGTRQLNLDFHGAIMFHANIQHHSNDHVSNQITVTRNLRNASIGYGITPADPMLVLYTNFWTLHGGRISLRR